MSRNVLSRQVVLLEFNESFKKGRIQEYFFRHESSLYDSVICFFTNGKRRTQGHRSRNVSILVPKILRVQPTATFSQ